MFQGTSLQARCSMPVSKHRVRDKQEQYIAESPNKTQLGKATWCGDSCSSWTVTKCVPSSRASVLNRHYPDPRWPLMSLGDQHPIGQLLPWWHQEIIGEPSSARSSLPFCIVASVEGHLKWGVQTAHVYTLSSLELTCMHRCLPLNSPHPIRGHQSPLSLFSPPIGRSYRAGQPLRAAVLSQTRNQ